MRLVQISSSLPPFPKAGIPHTNGGHMLCECDRKHTTFLNKIHEQNAYAWGVLSL